MRRCRPPVFFLLPHLETSPGKPLRMLTSVCRNHPPDKQSRYPNSSDRPYEAGYRLLPGSQPGPAEVAAHLTGSYRSPLHACPCRCKSLIPDIPLPSHQSHPRFRSEAVRLKTQSLRFRTVQPDFHCRWWNTAVFSQTASLTRWLRLCFRIHSSSLHPQKPDLQPPKRHNTGHDRQAPARHWFQNQSSTQPFLFYQNPVRACPLRYLLRQKH